jgi:flagellar basal-body rod protein FlgG
MLDYIMRIASINANKQFESLENISLNVANYNTTGYKAKRFEQYINSAGTLSGTVRVDTAKGDLMLTKNPLDIGVEGFGYIPVTQPDGTTAYTRDGSFTLSNKGMIITNRGDVVGEGITVPINYKQIHIKPDGTVQVQLNHESGFSTIGKIDLVRFANPEKLTAIGENKLLPSKESGEPQLDQDSLIKQGMLERGNVNIYTQVEQVLRLNAGLISNMRIIKFTDDLYTKAINLKQ